MSLYRGDLVTKENMAKNTLKIRKAFPSLPVEFYDVLLEMVKDEGFTDERFDDAVNHVIRTCVFPTPTVANFISYDQKIKIYDYDGYLKLCNEGTGKNYRAIKLRNLPRPVWIHVNDIAEYNLKDENEKNGSYGKK